MALTPRRANVFLLVALALVAIVFSSADAARAPKALEAAAADGRQAQAPTAGSDDAVPVERVVVVDKRGGGGGGGGGGHGGGGGGGGHGGEGGSGGHAGGGEGEGSRGFGGSAGYHGYGTGRGHKSSASSGRSDGVWKLGVAASVLGAAAWLL